MGTARKGLMTPERLNNRRSGVKVRAVGDASFVVMYTRDSGGTSSMQQRVQRGTYKAIKSRALLPMAPLSCTSYSFSWVIYQNQIFLFCGLGGGVERQESFLRSSFFFENCVTISK
jgi:hypothetical protein